MNVTPKMVAMLSIFTLALSMEHLDGEENLADKTDQVQQVELEQPPFGFETLRPGYRQLRKQKKAGKDSGSVPNQMDTRNTHHVTDRNSMPQSKSKPDVGIKQGDFVGFTVCGKSGYGKIVCTHASRGDEHEAKYYGITFKSQFLKFWIGPRSRTNKTCKSCNETHHIFVLKTKKFKHFGTNDRGATRWLREKQKDADRRKRNLKSLERRNKSANKTEPDATTHSRNSRPKGTVKQPNYEKAANSRVGNRRNRKRDSVTYIPDLDELDLSELS